MKISNLSTLEAVMPNQTNGRFMPRCFVLALITLIFLVSTVPVSYAEEADRKDFEYHPLLTDEFTMSLGVYSSGAEYKLSASSDAEPLKERNIDFDKTLGVDDQTTLFHGMFRWRFGEKWSLAGQYFRTNASGEAVLTDNIEWNDLLFREGTSAAAGVKTSVSRLFMGRVFSKGPQHELGAGVGLHNLKIDAFIEGEVLLNDGTSAFRKSSVASNAPLPNIGAWYMYSPARRWLVTSRIDFMTANIGDYDGTLVNGSIGVNYQTSRLFGIGLAYQYFSLDVGVDKSNWQGKVNLSYHGPVFSLTASW
jgi:hypothetical protein